MQWFVKQVCCFDEQREIVVLMCDCQDEPIRVAKPFPYYWDKPACEGLPDEIRMPIYSYERRANTGPPMYPDAGKSISDHHQKPEDDCPLDGVTELGMLRVKISKLPDAAVRIESGANGEEFYIVDFDIQMTLHSASLSFGLLVRGTKYHELSLDFS